MRNEDALISNDDATLRVGDEEIQVKVARIVDEDGDEHYGILTGMSRKTQRKVFKQKKTPTERFHSDLIIEGKLFKLLKQSYPAYYNGEGSSANCMSLLVPSQLKWGVVLNVSPDPIKEGLKQLAKPI